MRLEERADNRIGAAVVRGLVSTAISVPLSYLLLQFYIITSISVGHGSIIDQMLKAGLIAVGYASFFSGFFSSYFTRPENA
ncbi:MAG: hypothetical protein ACI9LV_000884 [Candidatus Nanohaloarchaea archaeon]|jgi:hypothetical protein